MHSPRPREENRRTGTQPDDEDQRVSEHVAEHHTDDAEHDEVRERCRELQPPAARRRDVAHILMFYIHTHARTHTHFVILI